MSYKISTPPPPRHIYKHSALVVDDQPEVGLLIQKMIRKMKPDWYVASVDSGERAIEMLKAAQFSVMLVDKNMPTMSGPETIEKARELQPGIPVILVTAFPTGDLYGANRLVTKPFTLDTLIHALDRCVASTAH